ncbi:MAG: hypothetical protein RL186_1619 [Pseudomonadota bacterium]
MADGALEDFNIGELDPMTTSASRTRATLTRRLQDVVGLPSSRITPQERHMAADLLIEVLRDSDTPTRIRCSERMALLSEAPALLLRFLAKDDIQVARPLLEVCEGFDDSDLIATALAKTATTEHRVLIAQRKRVSETVTDVLVGFREIEVVLSLLRNNGATFAHPAMEEATALSKHEPKLTPLLLKRPELKPSQGLTLFWWAAPEERKRIFQRFAVERTTLLDAAQDVFARAATEGWQDPLVRKTLQFVERRQRNRAAALRSPFGSLEVAIEALESTPPTREFFTEFSFLSGVKPMCGAQILSDLGGEAIAVLCKATGLKRKYLRLLWKGLRRPLGSEDEPNEAWDRALYVYDTLSTNKAQTVLRYWNWALTSAVSPALVAQLDGVDDNDLAFSVAARASQLVFGSRH